MKSLGQTEGITNMQTRISSIESQIHSSASIEFPNDFALELAELEMILAMKSEEGLEFDVALPSALVTSGNDWLFDFPADRFPLPAKSVAAIRICSGEDQVFCYAYDSEDGTGVRLAGAEQLDNAYIDFAKSYAELAGALEPMLAKMRSGDMH